jgi:hypothetical protein
MNQAYPLSTYKQIARQARADGRIKALVLPDNPGGNPALALVAIGTELLQGSCKGRCEVFFER